MSTTDTVSPDERCAYELIVSQNGLLQSELWKELDASSRKGSRLATSLEEKGLIEREQATHNGQRTYRLTPTNGDTSSVPETATDCNGGGSTTDSEPDETQQIETGRGDDPEVDTETREERALALIRDRGGIYQSEFWKALNVSSRTGSRIATSLEEEGLIRREEATYNGQRTYRLLPATKDLDFSLLMAGDMFSPLVGNDGAVDPIGADGFTQWILELERNER